MWLHSLKVAQLLRSAACLHTNQSRSYLNHLVYILYILSLFSKASRPALSSIQPPALWVLGTLYPRQPGRDTDHSHPVPRLRMCGVINSNSTPPHAFMACFVPHKYKPLPPSRTPQLAYSSVQLTTPCICKMRKRTFKEI